jgi:hypothetical protein
VARAEHTTARRPLLHNQVLLRQNPHNVGEWLQRSETTLSKTVQAARAVHGMLSQLVTRLLIIYEELLQNAAAASDLMADHACLKKSRTIGRSDGPPGRNLTAVRSARRCLCLARHSVAPDPAHPAKQTTRALSLA